VSTVLHVSLMSLNKWTYFSQLGDSCPHLCSHVRQRHGPLTSGSLLCLGAMSFHEHHRQTLDSFLRQWEWHRDEQADLVAIGQHPARAKEGKLDYKYCLAYWVFSEVKCMWLKCTFLNMKWTQSPNPWDFIFTWVKWPEIDEANLRIYKKSAGQGIEHIG
jgi:hypothetical protein